MYSICNYLQRVASNYDQNFHFICIAYVYNYYEHVCMTIVHVYVYLLCPQ